MINGALNAIREHAVRDTARIARRLTVIQRRERDSIRHSGCVPGDRCVQRRVADRRLRRLLPGRPCNERRRHVEYEIANLTRCSVDQDLEQPTVLLGDAFDERGVESRSVIRQLKRQRIRRQYDERQRITRFLDRTRVVDPQPATRREPIERVPARVVFEHVKRIEQRFLA
nr:hypothetical protein [Burkholderia pyrrocinia]